MNPLVRLRGVEKYFEHGVSRTYVLRQVNLDSAPGEFISIMGPPGAGKSTLPHLLGMHDMSWRGEYWLMDRPIHSLGKKERMELYKAQFGFVFQSYHLPDNLTIYIRKAKPAGHRAKPRSSVRTRTMLGSSSTLCSAKHPLTC